MTTRCNIDLNNNRKNRPFADFVCFWLAYTPQTRQVEFIPARQ